MRNIERITPFLNELGKIWGKDFKDWRFLQLMSNFMGWIYSEKKIDPFYLEESEVLEYFKEFAQNI